jgi:hypothetical protein
MTIHVEIPEPLAAQVADAAKTRATSPERYVLDAVSKTVAEDALLPAADNNGDLENPLVGLLADDPELADFLCQNAYHMRATFPMRTPGE